MKCYILTILFLLVPPKVLFAADKIDKIEFNTVCEADVSYTWKRRPPPEKTQGNQEATSKNDDIVPIKVVYARVGVNGKTEEEARNKLPTKLATIESEAHKYCEVQHQSQIACTSRELNKIKRDYYSSDYAVRRTLLRSITASCLDNAGICLSTEKGEVSCYIDKPPSVIEQEESKDEKASGSDENKKGKDKKKKKK